MNMSRLFAR